MRTIPVDLILHELVTRLAELPDTQHRDLHRAISNGCIRPQILAEEWTHGAGVAQQAARLVRRLDGEDMTAHRLREIAAETRAMEVAVARRLADCALSLLVTQDAEDRAAASTLLAAAHRVVGLERSEAAATTLGAWPPVVTIANLKTAEAENANKASIIAKQEKTIANLKSAALVGVAGVIADALHLEAKPGDSDPATLSRRCVEAIEHLQATVDARAEAALFTSTPNDRRLNVARDCLPSGVDIIACLRDDKPTTYKASNTGEEYDTPEGAVGAAWVHHMRPTRSVPDRAFKVGDKVRFARIRGGEAHRNNAPTLGWEGEITEIDGSGLPIRVEGVAWEGRWATYTKHGWWFTAADLDLVTPTA